jgi:hypothetical protein
VITVDPVEVSVMDVVDMVTMLDCFATASFTMLMFMVAVNVAGITD